MNVADPRVSPTGDYDVATKAYVDAAAGGGGTLQMVGTTTCPSPWIRAYSGYMAFPCSQVSGAIGDVFCSPVTSTSTTYGNMCSLLYDVSPSGTGVLAPLRCAVCYK